MTADLRSPRHVVVIGGGIAGLAAAYFLRRDAPALRVTVLEGGGEIGGKLRLLELDGLVVDAGAEAFLARRPEAVALARAVGLGGDLVAPATTKAAVWTRGAMRPMPTGHVMGIPGDLDALAASGLLTPAGLERAARDLDMPPSPPVCGEGSDAPEGDDAEGYEADGYDAEGDVALGTQVAARLGDEVVDRLMEPLLGGVYAGHARGMSAAMALPQMLPALRSGGSLIAAVRASQSKAAAAPASPSPAPVTASAASAVFAGIRGGVGRLPGAVAAASGAAVRVGATVRELRRTPVGWRVVVGRADRPEALEADAVVLAVPAPAAARLLSADVPAASVLLGAVEYASVGLVAASFPRAAFGEPPTGSGFLVPSVDGRVIKAATYSSVKWDWVGDAAGDRLVLRTSVGRHGEEWDLQRDDDDLTSVALADLCAATGLRGEPVAARVVRWGGALPQYAVGHRHRIDRARDAVARAGRLSVCGAVYDGVGIPACVAGAERAATEVLAALADPAAADPAAASPTAATPVSGGPVGSGTEAGRVR